MKRSPGPGIETPGVSFSRIIWNRRQLVRIAILNPLLPGIALIDFGKVRDPHIKTGTRSGLIGATLRSRLKIGARFDTKKVNRKIIMEEITAKELKEKLDAGDDFQLIDVRQPDEYAFAKIDGAKLIPLGDVLRRMGELDPTREAVIHCKMGGRSARAIEALQASGYKGKLVNLRGGITAWSNDVDPKIPKY